MTINQGQKKGEKNGRGGITLVGGFTLDYILKSRKRKKFFIWNYRLINFILYFIDKKCIKLYFKSKYYIYIRKLNNDI